MMRWLSIVVIGAMLLCSAGGAIADTTIAIDNFDDLDISDWAAGNCEVTTEDTYDGSAGAVECTHDGTVVLYKAIDRAVMQAYATAGNNVPIRLSYRFKIASTWPTDGGASCYSAGVKFARLRTDNQAIQIENYWDSGVACTNNEPLTVRGVLYHNTDLDGACNLTTSGSYGAAHTFDRGNWVLVVITYRLNDIGSSNGYLHIDMGGTRVLTRDNLVMRCSVGSVYNLFYVPSNIGDPSPAAKSITDDFLLEALDSEPTPTPTPTATPTPTPTPTATPTPTPTPTPAGILSHVVHAAGSARVQQTDGAARWAH